MSKRPWWNLGLFVPMLVALVLATAVSCGGDATATSSAPAYCRPAGYGHCRADGGAYCNYGAPT